MPTGAIALSYNLSVAPTTRLRRKHLLLVAACVLAAGVAGFYLGSRPRIQANFLKQAQLVAMQEDGRPARGEVRSTTYYFTMRGNWESVFEKAVEDLPGALESHRESHRSEVRELVLPRRDDGGRISLLFPPEKIFYFSPGRLVIDDRKRPIRRTGGDQEWTTVEVLEFRERSAIDALAEWLRSATHG